MKSYLPLYFVSAFQSWSSDPFFDRKNTNIVPTKSSVVGLICNSAGARRDDKNIIQLLSSLSIDTLSLYVSNIIRDYQTVGGENSFEILKINGKRRTNWENALVTEKRYLTNVITGAVIHGDDSLLNIIRGNIENPVRQLFFGRKNCLPSEAIDNPVCYSYGEAINVLIKRRNKSILKNEDKRTAITMWVDTNRKTTVTGNIFSSEGVVINVIHSAEFLVNDIPISFASNSKEFVSRNVNEISFYDDNIQTATN